MAHRSSGQPAFVDAFLRNNKKLNLRLDKLDQLVDWKPFDYFTTIQQLAMGLKYYRTIRLVYDGTITKLMVLISKPEQEAPEGFREFLETAAREGYKRLPSAIQAEVEKGKITAA